MIGTASRRSRKDFVSMLELLGYPSWISKLIILFLLSYFVIFLGPKEAFTDWKESFDFDAKRSEMSDLLVKVPEIRAIYSKLVSFIVTFLVNLCRVETVHSFIIILFIVEPDEATFSDLAV